VRVRDDGRGANDVSEGNGLTGMRARAEQVGGTLTAGPAEGAGWRVEAWLPGPARSGGTAASADAARSR
jgi:two-component system sensor histidine kinase UhpB